MSHRKKAKLYAEFMLGPQLKATGCMPSGVHWSMQVHHGVAAGLLRCFAVTKSLQACSAALSLSCAYTLPYNVNHILQALCITSTPRDPHVKGQGIFIRIYERRICAHLTTSL